MTATPVISEFLSSNSGGLDDIDGDSSDWIEIYNPTDAPVDLAGWRLTDDSQDLNQWVFPTATLDPAEYLLVFASGKDRAASGSELHTNFQLSSDGEYLALVDPLGAVVSEYAPQYPPQATNVSYGLEFEDDGLLQTGGQASIFVPEDDSLGDTWQFPSFVEDGLDWQEGTIGLGSGIDDPGFSVRYVKAKSSGEFDGVVNTLDLAESVLATPEFQSTSVIERAAVVNFLGTGAGDHFSDDLAFPMQNIGEDINHFVIEATATIDIPDDGQWSFGVNSDDGFGLILNGQSQEFRSSFPGTRAARDTIATFDLIAGQYEARVVMFEATGGASVEFFAAPGVHAQFSNDFKLVGDVDSGGLYAYEPYVFGQSELVKTDVGSLLINSNSSAYVRVPFNVDDINDVESLKLNIFYGDGFVAYINGVEAARRNAPQNVGFDSAATVARTTHQIREQEGIVLNSAAIAALVNGDNVLSIHGLNDSVSDPAFLISPELVSQKLLGPTPSFFATPTPGSLNQDPVDGVLSRVSIDVPAGFYDTTQTVSITSPENITQIYYTTDGNAPDATNGTLYVDPIEIDSTTTLRAIAVAPDYVSLPSVTRTYLFLDDVLQQSPSGSPPPGWPSTWKSNVVDYGIDPDVIALEGADQVKEALLSLPTLSLTTDLDNLFDPDIGIYSNAQQDGRDWERPVSAEWLNSDGSEGFQVNAGIRVRGGFSRSNNNPKHALKLFFRSSYGDSTLNYPVHGDEGVSEFKKLDLRTAQNYSWSFQGNASNNFIAEVTARYSQRELGQPYTRSTWVHLYLNGQYWGMYQTQERAEANFAESYLGGDADDYDVLKPERGAYQNIATDGNFDAYTELWQQAYDRAPDGITPAFVDDANYLRAQGKNPDGSENLDYPVLLDVDNLIVYMMETFRGGNLDAPISNFLGNRRPNNYFAIRDRTGREGFRFFQHDAEHTMRNVNENRHGPWNDANYEVGVQYFNPQWLHQQLMANEEYRMHFADMIQFAFFNEGPLSTSALDARIAEEAAGIDLAVIAESARWGDAKRGSNPPRTQADFRNAIASLRNSYLANRNPIVIDQFRNTTLVLKDVEGNYNVVVPAPLFPSLDAPAFLINGAGQHGGNIFPDSELRFDSPDGLVYYMTDGTDPRLSGGGIHPNALVYDPQQVTSTLVASGQDWKYLDDGSQPASDWTTDAFEDMSWNEGPSQLGYGGNGETTAVASLDSNGQKIITTYFRKSFQADFSSGSVVSATLRLRRDDGAAVYLNGVEIARSNLPAGDLNASTLASSVVGGDSETQWFEFSIDPSLLIDGENQLAAEVHQVSTGSSDITFDAELILQSQSAAPVVLADSVNVNARTLSAGGDWSALSQAFFLVPNVPASPDNLRLTEINYDPADEGDAEYLELTNISSGDDAVIIDLDGVTITDGPSVPYVVPLGTKLLPGQSKLIVRDVAAFTRIYPTVNADRIIGEYTGKISNSGERVRVVDASDNLIADLDYGTGDPWPKWADGVGGSLELIRPAEVPVEQTGKPYHYRGSVDFGGSPAAAAREPSGVIVNEVLSHTDAPLSDAIELFNPTDGPISIGGWFVSDEGDTPQKYRIPSGTVINAGGYFVIDESDFNPPLPTSDGLIPFALSGSSGDAVWVFSGNGAVSTGLEDHAPFDATFNGVSLGLLDGSGGRLVPLANRSLGTVNGAFETSPVVISEVNYHPAPPLATALALDPLIKEQDLEYIELFNASAIEIDLTGWRLRGDGDFDFADGEMLAQGERLVAVQFNPAAVDNAPRLAAFRAQYSIDETVRLVGPLTGSLGNSHGLVKLQAPDQPPAEQPTLTPRVTVDELFYDDLSPWAVQADGTGPSLQRVAASTLGNYHDSWSADPPSPGEIPGRPSIESISVNDGEDGRSEVTSVTVVFDREVTVSESSFAVTDRQSGQQLDSVQVATLVDAGKTTATLTFGTGAMVQARATGGNTLVDGIYQLNVISGNVRDAATGVAMSFDQQFGPASLDRFYRLFGDADGDGDVDAQDQIGFGGAFRRSDGESGYESGFDSDGNGVIDIKDFGQFRRNLLRVMPS